MTYDLKDDYVAEGWSDEDAAEFDSVETVEAIDASLKKLGHKTDRIGHFKSLVNRLARGDRWDLVFNIAEGIYGVGREAQVPAILDAYQIPYTFSDTVIMALTLQKALTKWVVQDLGVPTPDFVVVRKLLDITQVNLAYPLFAKPVAEGTGKGVTSKSKIADKKELTTACRELLERFKQPVLIERYLPGREFTVVVVGTGSNSQALGVMEIILKPVAEQNAYSYLNKENYKEVVEYEFPEDEVAEAAKKLAVQVHVGLNCRDSSRSDFRMDEHGNLQFMEINPIAGLHPVNSDMPIICNHYGIDFDTLIKIILDSAMERVVK